MRSHLSKAKCDRISNSRNCSGLWRIKSNFAIAKVLSCDELTVRKRLENIYQKLGVQTRTAAVMVALERLGLLKRGIVAISS